MQILSFFSVPSPYIRSLATSSGFLHSSDENDVHTLVTYIFVVVPTSDPDSVFTASFSQLLLYRLQSLQKLSVSLQSFASGIALSGWHVLSW